MPLLGIQDLCETQFYAELQRTLHPYTQVRCSASGSGSTSIADVRATLLPAQRMKQCQPSMALLQKALNPAP
jgi:hypothetical protein